MMQRIKNSVGLLRQEIISHKLIYGLLLVVFFGGLFLRTYRFSDLLGFYYDQGRDALEVYKILGGDPAFIGPTTGFFGIFRGPFFYYWLIPGYLLGNGNPAIAATYISSINALGILVVFAIGAVFFSRITGLISAALVAFSYYAILSGRWLSNPSPVWLFGPLAFLFIVLGITRAWYFMPLGLLSLGITLQLEEAGMGFVVIATLVFLLLNLKRLHIKQWAISAFAFLVTFTPLLLFDLNNRFLISGNVIKLIFGESGEEASFGVSDKIGERIFSYSGEFGKELFINANMHTFKGLEGMFLVIFYVGLFFTVRRYIKNKAYQFLLLWFFIPIALLLFYQKPLYEYYIVGQYPIFFLMVGLALAQFKRFRFGMVMIFVALIIFVSINTKFLKGYLTSRVAADSTTIALENQRQAMQYIFESAGNQSFATAVYVPPQLTYSYDYLFKWYRKSYFPHMPETPLDQAQLFYTLHENDNEHPKLAEEWVKNQDAKGTIIEQKRFGGIWVEKRTPVRSQ